MNLSGYGLKLLPFLLLIVVTFTLTTKDKRALRSSSANYLYQMIVKNVGLLIPGAALSILLKSMQRRWGQAVLMLVTVLLTNLVVMGVCMALQAASKYIGIDVSGHTIVIAFPCFLYSCKPSHCEVRGSLAMAILSIAFLGYLSLTIMMFHSGVEVYSALVVGLWLAEVLGVTFWRYFGGD